MWESEYSIEKKREYWIVKNGMEWKEIQGSWMKWICNMKINERKFETPWRHLQILNSDVATSRDSEADDVINSYKNRMTNNKVSIPEKMIPRKWVKLRANWSLRNSIGIGRVERKRELPSGAFFSLKTIRFERASFFVQEKLDMEPFIYVLVLNG